MDTRAETRFWLLTGLNVLVAVWVVLWLLAYSLATGGLVPQIAPFFWAFLIFLVIPVGILLIVVLGRKVQVPSRAHRAYFGISYAVGILAWVSASVPALIFGTMIYIQEPWPISLRQGPDADHARAGFERTLGFAPPSSVTSVYYYSVSFRDWSDYLRFDFADTEVVDRIVSRFNLIEVPEEVLRNPRHGSIHVDRSYKPWWTAHEINAIDLIYVDRDTYDSMRGPTSGSRGTQRIVWVDTSEGRAFYNENGFKEVVPIGETAPPSPPGTNRKVFAGGSWLQLWWVTYHSRSFHHGTQ